jgi:hypothetical protein
MSHKPANKRRRLKRRRDNQRRDLRRPINPLPVAAVSTAGLIADLARPLSSRAFDEALKEQQI